MEADAKPSQNPRSQPPPPPAAAAAPAAPAGRGNDRDFLLHLEAYLSRRDGVDKLLKISRYAAKIALASPSLSSRLPGTLAPRLKAFESSVGLSRKAFRLGKFVQDLNSLRAAGGGGSGSGSGDQLLAVIAYGGEGLYYFVEQFVWLAKAGLIPSELLPRLQRISAWAELVGYFGSVALKTKELKKIRSMLESKVLTSKVMGCSREEGEIRKLKEKMVLKQLSIVQDLADGLMALGDVTDGKGFLSNSLLMASAGLLSALISTQKNWKSC